MKNFLRIPLSFAATVLLGIGCGPSDEDTQPAAALSDEERVSADINSLGGMQAVEWWRVRKALSKYKDVNVALADGYVSLKTCGSTAAGGGGIHYVNLSLARDLVSDPYKPEFLLYVPNEEGGFDLHGVEYFQAAVGQPAPSVLGQTFDGPMDPHGPGQPVHFDLHVWLYKYNPSGLFSQWNPRSRCPAP
jgi:hypothetical protein